MLIGKFYKCSIWICLFSSCKQWSEEYPNLFKGIVNNFESTQTHGYCKMMGEFTFADLNLILIWSWCCCHHTSKRQSLLFILVVFVVHFWTSSGAQWYSLPCTWTLYSHACSICMLAGTQVQVKQCVGTSKVAGVKTGGVSRWIFVAGIFLLKKICEMGAVNHLLQMCDLHPRISSTRDLNRSRIYPSWVSILCDIQFRWLFYTLMLLVLLICILCSPMLCLEAGIGRIALLFLNKTFYNQKTHKVSNSTHSGAYIFLTWYIYIMSSMSYKIYI
jgi:hypothetical protein